MYSICIAYMQAAESKSFYLESQLCSHETATNQAIGGLSIECAYASTLSVSDTVCGISVCFPSKGCFEVSSASPPSSELPNATLRQDTRPAAKNAALQAIYSTM